MTSNTPFALLIGLSPAKKKTPNSENPTPSRKIEQIIAQNEIRQQNLQYQHLLIESKELQIKLGQIQNEYDALVKKRKKIERGVEDMQTKRDQALHQCKEKKYYLQKYYAELDKKFRTGKDQLFGSLKKLEANLLEMYDRDERRLKESLKSEEESLNRLMSKLNSQREKRQYLQNELGKLEGVSGLSEQMKIDKDKKDIDRSSISSENQFLKEEIERLTKQNKNYESEEKVLKRILSIEEEHRKYCNIIENGIKKLFAIKLKEQRYKEAVSKDYSKNIDHLQGIIVKRKQQKENLVNEIEEKRRRLQKIMWDVNQKNQEYGQLEDEHIKLQKN